MLYRPIRGSLRRAMEETKEITTWKELISLIDASYYEHPLIIDALYEGMDDRINWDTYLVCAKMPEYDHTTAAGYLNDNPNKLIDAPVVVIKSIAGISIPRGFIIPYPEDKKVPEGYERFQIKYIIKK